MISKKKSNSRSLTRQAKPNPRGNPVKVKNLPRVALAAAYSKQQRSSEPRVQGSYRKTNIKHRELIYSITGTSAFTVANSFSLNPGIATTFPWLSIQAQGWEQYHFNKLKFCYYTRTGTTSVGSVLLAPDYDAADSAPSTEQIASTYRGVVEEVPWVEEFCCNLDIKAMHPSGPKYVRTGTLADNLDIKTYDGGNFHVCTVDGQSVNWGKLWVEYDVDFLVPQLPPSGPALSYSGKVSSTSSTLASIFTNSTQVGLVPLVVSGSSLSFQLPGQYIVLYSVIGSVITAKPVTTGSTVVVGFSDASVNSASTFIMGFVCISVTAANQTLILNFSSVATGVTSAFARISPYGSS